MGTTEVVVGRIGKPHGLTGELSVEPRSDEPERRFNLGARLGTQSPRTTLPAGRPVALTVASMRWHQTRLLVRFEEVASRTEAEALRGLMLLAEVDEAEVPEDPEEFYDHQIVGLPVVTPDGRAVGELADVVHGSAQDLLRIRADDGRVILVPFVSQLVPEVDVPRRRIVVADLPGLLGPLAGDGRGGS